MMIRRNFLFTESLAVVAPAIVRINNVMRVHSIHLVSAPLSFGLFERWSIHLGMREIESLNGDGMSPAGIAAELNRRAAAGNGYSHWDPLKVKFVMERDQLIRATDRAAR